MADVEAEVQELHLEHEPLRKDEIHRARRHLLLVEKDRAIDLHQRGVLGPGTYERLLADIDARLLRLESGEEPGGRDRGVEPHRRDR